MDDLPNEFDVIIVGTGLAESIVSAAVARSGHSVLHLDPRDYYGGKWTTINWETLESGNFAADPPKSVSENSEFVWSNAIHHVESNWYVEDEEEKKAVRDLNRRFNIDVFPKALLAREEIIQLLIDSNVSRYLEFKCIQKLYASLPNSTTIEPVPLSRSDIFLTKSLSLIEKRKLTKFIELVLKQEGEKDETGQEEQKASSFKDLVEQSKVNEKIQHLLKQAVKTVQDEFEPEKLEENFVERCKLFLKSIGRYGNQTPHLWTLYGVGEICQAFCRLSAIYAGIFILKRSVQKLRIEPDQLVVTSDGLELKTKNLILGPELRCSQAQRSKYTKTLLRAILLVKGGPLFRGGEDDDPEVVPSHMAVYKIGEFEVIELDHSSLAVPKPYYLVQVTAPAQQDPPRTVIERALEPYLDFHGSPVDPSAQPEAHGMVDGTAKKPVVIFGSYFVLDFFSTAESIPTSSAKAGPRVYDCSTLSTEITAEILRAKEIFSSMFPEEEFLPKTPDVAPVEDGMDEEIMDGALPEDLENIGAENAVDVANNASADAQVNAVS